jgi:hypothetical protein
VDLRGQSAKDRMLGRRRFEVEHSVGGTWLVRTGAWYEIGEDTDAVFGLDLQPHLFDGSPKLVAGEPSGQVIMRSPSGRRLAKDRERFGRVSAENPCQDHGIAVCREQAQGAARTKHPGHRLEGEAWVVDELEHGMAQNQVGRGGAEDDQQIGGVALDGAQVRGHPCLSRASLECGERIRARIDNGHPMPELGDRNREASGATARINDVELLVTADVHLPVESVPDDAPLELVTHGSPVSSGCADQRVTG